MIRKLDREIGEIEVAIKTIVDEMSPPIPTVPGISYRIRAMILAEIGDFSHFDLSDKLLAHTGLSPSTSLESSMQPTVIPTWRNVVLGICDTH